MNEFSIPERFFQGNRGTVQRPQDGSQCAYPSIARQTPRYSILGLVYFSLKDHYILSQRKSPSIVFVWEAAQLYNLVLFWAIDVEGPAMHSSDLSQFSLYLRLTSYRLPNKCMGYRQSRQSEGIIRNGLSFSCIQCQCSMPSRPLFPHRPKVISYFHCNALTISKLRGAHGIGNAQIDNPF